MLRGSTHKVSFFFNDTATTEIYTLSLHDALPISSRGSETSGSPKRLKEVLKSTGAGARSPNLWRSEEHTSELQSQSNLVCRLLLEKKNNTVHDVAGHPLARSLPRLATWLVGREPV